MVTTTMKAMLLSALTVVLVWRAVALGHQAGGFGLRATVDASRVELTLTLPILCDRLSAHFMGELMAISATPCCSRCQAPVTGLGLTLCREVLEAHGLKSHSPTVKAAA